MKVFDSKGKKEVEINQETPNEIKHAFKTNFIKPT